MVEVRNVQKQNRQAQSELPMDTDALFSELKNDPLLQTDDMQVQGDWTYRQLADHMSAKEFVNGDKFDFQSFKQTDWASLDPGASVQSFLDGSSAVEGSFGAGDPGIGVSAGNGYNSYGRAGNSSALTYDGDNVATASEGTRALAFNAPNGVDLAQLINRYDWGYQASIVAAILTNLPDLGNSSNWKVPSYGTASGRIAFASAYNFNYSSPLGVPVMSSTFSINSNNAETYNFIMRDSSNEEVASTEVDMSEGGQDVTVTWVNVPASGLIQIESNGTAYTIEGTQADPPML